MLRRSSFIATLAILVLAIAACGVDPAGGSTPVPTPTPAADLTVSCLSTEAYASEHIVAVIGEDSVPTAFDAINSGSCEASEPIVQLRITLTNGDSQQGAIINLPSGTTSFAAPFADASVPTLSGSLAPGRYERVVTAIAEDGREVEVAGFEPVILVKDAGSTQAELLKAQSRWERSSLRAYTYTMRTDCFCPREIVAAVDVQIVGANVTAVTFVDAEFTGEVPEQQRFGTINDLLEIVQDGLDRNAYSIRAEYDAQTGFPMEVFIDYEAMMADEEHGFRVSNLRY
jgi:hypothetical protein